MKDKIELQASRNIAEGTMFVWFWIMVLGTLIGIGCAIGYSEHWKAISFATVAFAFLTFLKYDRNRLLIETIDKFLPYAK